MSLTRASTRLHATLTSSMAKLQKRVQSKTKILAIELPKFRYIDDITRFLENMAQEVDDTDKLIKVYQTQLAYLKKPKDWVESVLTKAAMEFTISPGGKKSNLTNKIDPELKRIVVPNIKKLQEQYALSEDLYEKHRTLEAVEAQIAMQFPDRRGEAYEATMKSLALLKNKVGKQLKTVLSFLNEVASKHVPTTFSKYMDAVRLEVQEHVLFEKSELFLYVSTSPDKELVFTYYLMLLNATNDDGEVTPHLYISIQWVVGSSVNVQIHQEYELPNQLLGVGGVEVNSVGEAVKAISSLLRLEDFSSALGTIPLSTQLRKPVSELNPNIFSYKDFISRLAVDNNSLIFKLRKGVTEEQIKEIGYALYQEVKFLFHNSRKIKLRMRTSLQQIEFDVVSLAENNEVNYHDAEFLRQKFDLSEVQLRKVVNLLNMSKKDKI